MPQDQPVDRRPDTPLAAHAPAAGLTTGPTTTGPTGASGRAGGQAIATVVAVATRDPLAPTTFSGYSSHLFGGMRDRGVNVIPLASRDLRVSDLPAALNLAGFARGKLSGRDAPRIRPNWFWSRAGFEKMSRRLNERLAQLPDRPVLLQVGTHVLAQAPGTRSYCVTDCTVVQALEGGEFAISQASPRVAREAVDCQRAVFHACDKVLTVTRWAADSVVRDYGVPADRVVVVGGGANLPADPPPRRVDPSNPYVLFVGMDWEQKGGPLLLEALRLVRATRPEVTLKVVGCHPDVPTDGVEVVGYLPPTDPAARQRLLELYAGASCLPLLSRFDTFGHVLVEAQLSGVPVIALPGQGRPEALRHGQTGLLVDAAIHRNAMADAVARALLTVLADDLDGPQAMSRAARAFARAHATWPVVVDRVLRALDLPLGQVP